MYLEMVDTSSPSSNYKGKGKNITEMFLPDIIYFKAVQSPQGFAHHPKDRPSNSDHHDIASSHNVLAIFCRLISCFIGQNRFRRSLEASNHAGYNRANGLTGVVEDG